MLRQAYSTFLFIKTTLQFPWVFLTITNRWLTTNYGLRCAIVAWGVQDSGATIAGGAVAKSGFGDGAYSYQIAKRDGLVVGVRINFITDDEFE